MMSRKSARSLLRRGRLKRIALLLAGIFFSLVLLEASPFLLYYLLRQRPFPRTEIQIRLMRARQEAIALAPDLEAEVPDHITNKILHPYLGFTADPRNPKANELGFYTSQTIPKRSEDRLIVALFGGSVAMVMPGFIAEAFREQALERGVFAGRELEMVNLSIDGYKQPQQLLALNYLLALGAEFDIVINLDGFNELALTYTENLTAGLPASYPRSWDLFSQQAFALDLSLKIADIHRIKSQRQAWSRLMSIQPFRSSNFCLALWKTLDERLFSQLYAADSQLRNKLRRSPASASLAAENAKPFLAQVVGIWRSGSLQMARLCQANDIDYFHFLQPNQYLPGSKPLSSIERSSAYLGDAPFRRAIELGYPLLVREGGRLTEQGVRFSDMTMIFRKEERTVYIDTCCHLNPFGYRILAKEMVQVILDGLEGRTQAASDR